MGMNFGSFARGLGPIVAIGLAAALAGCDGAKVTFDGEQGKPLEELDLTGAAPTGVALLGPDTVRITRGDTLTIRIDGDPEAASAMRFTLKDGKLGILRKDGNWGRDKAVSVNVTLPALSEIAAMGSGSVSADRIGGKASVSIGGSGSVETAVVEANRWNSASPVRAAIAAQARPRRWNSASRAAVQRRWRASGSTARTFRSPVRAMPASPRTARSRPAWSDRARSG